MKIAIGAVATVLASTTLASAGGLDYSGQSIGIIFEEGTYVELSYGYVESAISGFAPSPIAAGSISPTYSLLAGGFKVDMSDRISAALIMDQPFGLSADYTQGFYTGTNIDLTSSAVTALVSFDITENVVIYSGAVMQSMSLTAANSPAFSYSLDAAQATGAGYIVGAAFQIPEHALRIALTYRSEIATEHDTVENSVVIPLDTGDVITVTTPQSLTLDFQSGLGERAQVFGSVRWVEWSKFDITPENYLGGSFADYKVDVTTYSLGIAYELTDTLSGALMASYEETQDIDPSVFVTTSGYTSVGASLTYTYDNLKITGSVESRQFGDISGPMGTFENNSEMVYGLKISYSL